jgi:hypothetical protein
MKKSSWALDAAYTWPRDSHLHIINSGSWGRVSLKHAGKNPRRQPNVQEIGNQPQDDSEYVKVVLVLYEEWTYD